MATAPTISLPTSIARLGAAGVRLVWFNRCAAWSLDRVNYRTHRKVLVVDGTVAFTGGVGLADHWRGNAHRIPITGETRRCSVRGPAVRALEASFYENWIESGGAEAPRLDPEPAEQRQATPGCTQRSSSGATSPAAPAT